MIRCSRCVMPSTRPDIEFVDGVCSACIAHEKRKEINWEERHKQLCQILEGAPRIAGFDCIVPSSGGKDSHYQVKTLLDLGAKPLVVTASTCHLTAIGRRNIDNLAEYATTIEYSPNKAVRARLNFLGLDLVGDISWPEHVAINVQPWKVAVAMGIPLMFYGENPTREYGGPLDTHENRRMTRRWISEFGGQLGLRPSDIKEVPGHLLEDYILPSQESLDRLGINAYFLGQFIAWDSRRNASVAMDMGMEAELAYDGSWWPWENLDNAQTGLHDWFGYLKYGYNRASAQLSVDVRNGVVTRDFAQQEARRLDAIFPRRYGGVPILEVLDRIGIDMNTLVELMNRFTNADLFTESDDVPVLKEPT